MKKLSDFLLTSNLPYLRHLAITSHRDYSRKRYLFQALNDILLISSRNIYSLICEGKKISDEQIKEYLTELVCKEGFFYGYRKLKRYCYYTN